MITYEPLYHSFSWGTFSICTRKLKANITINNLVSWTFVGAILIIVKWMGTLKSYVERHCKNTDVKIENSTLLCRPWRITSSLQVYLLENDELSVRDVHGYILWMKESDNIQYLCSFLRCVLKNVRKNLSILKNVWDHLANILYSSVFSILKYYLCLIDCGMRKICSGRGPQCRRSV